MATIAQPPDNALEEKDWYDKTSKKWICSTCWTRLQEPFIKGIFVHPEGWIMECNKTDPVEWKDLDTSTERSCNHDFKVTKDLKGGVKCSKCGFPFGINHAWTEHSSGKYFCKDCNKRFKNLSMHSMKVHKSKVFNFQVLHFTEAEKKRLAAK